MINQEKSGYSPEVERMYSRLREELNLHPPRECPGELEIMITMEREPVSPRREGEGTRPGRNNVSHPSYPLLGNGLSVTGGY